MTLDADPERLAAEPGNTRSRWVIAGYVVAGILALIPAVRMIDVIRQGSAMQNADYWAMLPRFLNQGGGLDLGALVHFQNEHPVVIAQLLYWFNVRAFSASNIALGFIIVAIVVGELAVIALLLRHSTLRPIDRMVVFILASAGLFDLTGAWNFSKAMSGTAWFTANLFVLGAVYLRSRDRQWPAFAVAILAAMSYGTGILVWPAMIATGMCRRPIKECWREWPSVVGFIATAIWYRASGSSSTGDYSHPRVVFRLAAGIMGFVLGLEGHVAERVGYVALIAVPILAIYFVLSRGLGAAGFVGVATFGWLALVEICSGRLVFLEIYGAQNRYSSLAALTWIGFVSLLVMAVRDAGRRLTKRRANAGVSLIARLAGTGVALLLGALLVTGAMTAGRAHADTMIEDKYRQQLSEIALRMGMSDSLIYVLFPYGSNSNITKLMRSVGHYPFVDNWDLDCGLNGKRLDASPESNRPAIKGAVLSGQAILVLPHVAQIAGHVVTDRPIRCIVVANDRNVVVGAAAVGADAVEPGQPEPSGTGFQALAKRGGTTFRVYVILHGSTKPRLLGRILQSRIPATVPAPAPAPAPAG